MKKMLNIIFLNILMIFPLFIKAETYKTAEEISSSYMERTNFKNSYKKYIFIQDSSKLGGLITKEEFEITRYNQNKEYKSIGYSYLWDSRPYWSKSKDGEKHISISNGYNSYEAEDEENTKNIKIKITEYAKSNVSVFGSGTYNDPWLFAPEYKIYLKVNDISKGYITEKTNKTIEKAYAEYYLTANSSPEYIYINSKGSNQYIGTTCGYIINGIDGNKDLNSGNGPYLLLSNVTRDIECTINFGEKPSEIILSQDKTECGKSIPEKVYFTTSTGWYQDQYGNTSINSLTQNPCRIGYTFDGYRNSTDFASSCSASKIIDEKGILTTDISTLKLLSNKQTLYPCYNPNTYTITYDVNGGNAITSNTKEVVFDSLYGALPTATRTGYIFAGWYTEKENGSKITSGTTVTNPSNHTLYAHWTPITYSISYNTAGGSLGSKAPTSNLKYDDPAEISFPTRQGYDFAGWTASGDLNTSTAKFGNTKNNVSTNSISSTSTKITTNYLINLSTTNNGTITLTATWTPRNDTPYVVKHWKQKLNGGTEKNTTNYVLDETENLEGTTMEKATSTLNTYTGFTSPSKQTPLIAADGSTVINYYYDRKEYTVTISRNNTSYGTVTSSSVELDYGNTYSTSGSTISFTNGTNVTASPTSKTGYTTTFSSWSSTSGTITADETVTANFTRTANTYTVQYDCNGGTGSTADSSHTYDVEKALTTNGCSKTGYTFSGWSTTSTGTALYTDKQKVKNLSSTNNDTVKLFAVWTINSYEVTVNKGTGIKSVSGVGDYNYNASVTVGYTLNTGYHFVNWTGDKTTATFNMPASDVDMTANGAANTYKVKYNCNTTDPLSTAMSDSSHTYDVSKNLTEHTCVKTNYNFVEWNTKQDGSGTAYSDQESVKNLTSTNNGSITLYAQWELADTENPTCKITASSSGLKLTTNDDSGVHSYDLTTSATASYNNKNTASLSASTFYGYVKDNVGKTGSCSITISNASADKYTCSKSAIKYSYPSCDTKAKYDSPSSACASGTTYSSNTCSRNATWSADKVGCGPKYKWTGTCQCYQYPGGSKTSKTCTASTCSSTCSGYNYGDGTCTQEIEKYWFSGGGTEYGLDSCTEYTFTCDANHVGQVKVTNCTKLDSYKYSGSVTCYSYYCNSDEGTKDGTKCYKYNQSSCSSGWTSSISSYKCASGKSLISGTAYCK